MENWSLLKRKLSNLHDVNTIKIMKKILLCCLSNSWGGLEMVSMEMAMEFEQQGFEVVFLCYQNSVVYQKIKDKIKKTEVLNYEDNLFSKIIKLGKVIKRNGPDKLVINRLPSLKYGFVKNICGLDLGPQAYQAYDIT